MEVAINNPELATLSSNAASNPTSLCNTVENANANAPAIPPLNVNPSAAIKCPSSNGLSLTPSNLSDATLSKVVESASTLEKNNSNDTTQINPTTTTTNNTNATNTSTTTTATTPVPGAPYPNPSLTSNLSISNRTFRSTNGRPRKPGSTYVFKEENIQSYTDANGVVYKVAGESFY